MKTITTKLLLLVVVLWAGFVPLKALSGSIHLNSEGTGVNMLDNSYYRLVLTSKISDIGFSEVKTKLGVFSMLGVEGYGKRNIVGEPALPVYRRLIEVPLGSTFVVNIVKQHYQEIDLSGTGVKYQVFPAQHPVSKSEDPERLPFEYNATAYSQNAFTEDPLVTVTPVGLLRALNLARLDISPIQYNPVQNKLRVYDVLEVEIVFQNGDIPATIGLKQTKASPYFNSLYALTANYKELDNGDALITSAPVTYVIVSDPMFQTTLQPFIAWKKKKGYKIIEGYTNNPSVGTTTTSIKAYLQGLYNSPPAGYNVPSFVLLVGDVAQIPAWSGSAGSHYTDLRYFEYTGDNLPEILYGRFSATSVAELQPQIDKTLEYEQYLMPDPSFLNEACMVAGADAGYQTHSNGQIYYGTETYFNAAHNMLSHTYLQPEPTGGNYSAQIIGNVSSGVSFANYTAHCSSNGWADPSFVISDIAGLTNAHKYGLLVGNCCLSAKFDVSSFAEEQLRAANKGAVGYIGGSNNTYWDEDFWWGCGFKTVVLHPTYTANHIGAYDGAFHDHGEPTSNWFITQGQMLLCGDYAVEESGSSRRTYYWEIYHLMGDPSLMTYFSVPPVLTATYQNTLMIGMTSLAVTTEPYAYIALSSNGVLLDAKLADVTGAANLTFDPLNTVGNLDIVITKQNRQPHISTIQVIPASGPYVVYTAHTLSDPTPGGNNNGVMDYNETDLLSVSLKNVGVAVANNVIATLSTTNTYITLTDNTENYGNIDPNVTVNRTNAFSLNVANNIPDQQVVAFNLLATNGTSNWTSHFNITANAPVLSIGVMSVQDPGGDNDGILDPGETANLVIACSNTGHASLDNVSGLLAIVGGSSPYLTLNSVTSNLGTLAAGGSGNAIFNVTASVSTPLGTPVDLQFTLSGGAYSTQATKQVIIGLIPTYIITNGTVTTCPGTFYDSGGASGAYQNSENFTETFYPSTPGAMMRFTFTSFDTESGYDYLKVYNGTSTSAPLIGTYHGTTGPGTVTASNASGALTFNFTSDGSVTKTGWVATISCYSVTNPPVADFSASSTSPAINSTVTFTDLTTNIPTGWSWSFTPNTVVFVNGTSATSQNPQVQFTALGQYTVSLTASNAYGSDVESKINYLNVINYSYCTPTYTSGTGYGDYITLVQLGTINNATGASASPYYTYYSSLSTDLTPGNSYTITLSPGTYSSGNYIGVWIDFNQNGNWDANEKLGLISIAPTPATGTINFTVPLTAVAGTTRMRVREVWNNSAFDPCSSYGYGETEDYNVNILSLNKTLNLTVFLEGLYTGSGTMRKAQNETGDQYPGTTADQITVELHNAANYANIIYSAVNVNLSTSGQASIVIPGSYSGSYYVTVKNRNGLETTTASPVSFSASTITYSFNINTQAYGDNLHQMGDGAWVIYSGDVNQDGIIDSGDMIPVDNIASTFGTGYMPEDANGDGLIDSGDMILLDNSAANFVARIVP
jgi:PKD repeat protein